MRLALGNRLMASNIPDNGLWIGGQHPTPTPHRVQDADDPGTSSRVGHRSPPCCIPGERTCCFIPICTARHAASHSQPHRSRRHVGHSTSPIRYSIRPAVIAAWTACRGTMFQRCLPFAAVVVTEFAEDRRDGMCIEIRKSISCCDEVFHRGRLFRNVLIRFTEVVAARF